MLYFFITSDAVFLLLPILTYGNKNPEKTKGANRDRTRNNVKRQVEGNNDPSEEIPETQEKSTALVRMTRSGYLPPKPEWPPEKQKKWDQYMAALGRYPELAQPGQSPQKEQPSQYKREIQCFTCVNAKTNDECNAAGQTTCQLADASCMTEVRNFGYGEKLISKKCKDKNSCHIQQKSNNYSGRWGKQCQPDWFESVCRCCCMDDLCNAAELPCLGVVEEKDCDLAPTLKPLNGTVSCSNGKKTNSKCTITCDEGFTISGGKGDSTAINCAGSGKWSGLINNAYPKCEIKRCPFILDNPIEGVTSCSLGEEYGSSCSIFCNQGYSLTFKERVTSVDQLIVSCVLVDGQLTWQYNESPELVQEEERLLADSTNMPTCQFSKCEELRINGASMSCTDSNMYKSVCTIQCDAGRRRQGPAKQICRGLQVPSWQGVDEIGATKCVQDIDG